MNLLGRLIAALRPNSAQSDDDNPLLGFVARPNVEDLPVATDEHRIVRDICEQAVAASDNGWQAKLSDSARWLALKGESETTQIAVMMAAVDIRPDSNAFYSGTSWQVQNLRSAIVSQILRRNLPFSSAQLALLLHAWLQQPFSLDFGFPGRAVLGAVKRYGNGQRLDAGLQDVLVRLRTRILKPNKHVQLNKFHLEVLERIEGLLDPDKANEFSLPVGPFADRFIASCSALADSEMAHWAALAALCAQAGDKSKPSLKWLASADTLVDQIGRGVVTSLVSETIGKTVPDPAQADPSLDILKGLVWLTTLLDHSALAGQVGRFAETCFRKVPSYGARSVKLGNAALWALSGMAEEPRAAAELFRLGDKVKYPSARKVIDARLAELATRAGQSLDALEDMSLPTYGLDADSVARFSLGGCHAEIAIEATRTAVRWINAAGKSVKAPPAEVREHHRADLAAFRQAAKDIEAARAGQAQRLEQSWLQQRDWRYADWQRNFLHHPLRGPVVSSLIWSVGGVSAMPCSDGLVAIDGQPVLPDDDARIALWHPLFSQPAEVLVWRHRILEEGMTQPIRQAHREIYVLTDAEGHTGVYSNRFAAHILRQHQFRALCQARGWKYDLMGGWDNWNVPTKPLPWHDMSVEYQVEIVEDGRVTDAWVALHLASDQVRFLDQARQPVALEHIAPIVLSEVFRDVDLFVAVTSVANDPDWTDGGPNGHHGGYWREWAFGELGQSAEMRRDLLGWLLPKLSIADRLEVSGKFLIVQGKRQKYAIHLGSGNIQILPSKRYLCIVLDRAPAEATNLRLPFAGDGLLSTILAKASMLVDEDSIRDPTIISQL